MHTAILHYKGYTITVENYLYRIKLQPGNVYLTFSDAMKAVDRIDDATEATINKILNTPNGSSQDPEERC